MPHKKGQKPDETDEKQALEQRVDAMLDPKRPDGSIPDPKDADAPPPLDIFEGMPQKPDGTKTAPEVPDKLMKEATPAPSAGSQPKMTRPVSVEAETPVETDASGTADRTTELDDQQTDQAVDDIAASEADTMLAVQDAIGRKKSQPAKVPGWRDKLRRLLSNKRTWIGLAALLIILFSVPYTRYKLLGLFIKESVTVTVFDSKTNTPVSSAEINIAGVKAKTSGNGKAMLKAVPGNDKFTVSKKYYKTYSSSLFIKLRSGNTATVRLVAVGRQVPVTVLNRITGLPLSNAEIKVLNTTAKTDSHGKATIVLPATAASDKATISLNGYNTAKTAIIVTSKVVNRNTFTLTPTGQVYFLSNLNGTIDVVKANLDGSGRQIVLAGTGRESPATTSLLASRDWRYLVLKTRRNTAQPALYLIDTGNDKLVTFDANNASFNLIGWYGHDFMYDLVSNTTPQSHSGHETVKSYDADHLQLNLLDQSQAEGTSSSYGYQDFYNFYILNNLLAYNTMWASSSGYSLKNKADSIRAVQPDGLNKKDYQTFTAAGVNYILAALYQPQAIYYDVNKETGQQAYYNFANQTAKPVSIDQSVFGKNYPTYLISPSGNQTFWADPRDGKYTLFTGDADAQHAKQIASLSQYAPYGWYGDTYALVSKNNSELYIMPATGLKSGRQPVKITDYFKPIQTYSSYGYGYGGL